MLVFLSFLFFTFLVAFITYIKTKDDNLSTNEGYFLGGRSLTGGLIAGSLLLTNLNATSLVHKPIHIICQLLDGKSLRLFA